MTFKNNTCYVILLILSVAAFICSASLLFSELKMGFQGGETKKMQKKVVSAAGQGSNLSSENENGEILSVDYSLLSEDTIGWIYIPDTNINYPIMQTDNNDFYQSHDAEGKAAKTGAIFMDCRSKGDAVKIIYGHNMRLPRMFSELKNYYRDKDFKASHPDILISFKSGQSAVYHITDIKIVPEDDDVFTFQPPKDISQPSDYKDLILCTCYGEMPADKRLLIYIEETR